MLSLIAALAIATPAVQAPDFAAAAKEIERHFAEREQKGFSGVVFIAHAGKVLSERAYGQQDREGRIPMSMATAFDIGSITKPLTRAAILRLAAEKKLSLTDPIARFFPDVPEDKKGITVQHLLSHTSGLDDTFGRDYYVVDREWILSQAMESDLLSKPGEKNRYSNAGYSLLAAIIEEASGLSYEQYMHSAIFEPAGVRRIGYLRGGWKPAELAVGYRRNGERWGTPLDHEWAKDGPGWNLRGNGGMISDARELHQVFQAVVYGQALPREAQMQFLPVREGRPRSLAAAGGNGVFNALYVLLADSNFVFIGMSSRADHQVEDSEEFLQEVFQPLRRLRQ
jgi:CubicO group peptidase (beta-lactamase class C family)